MFFYTIFREKKIPNSNSGLGIADFFSINIPIYISFRLPKMRSYIKKKVWSHLFIYREALVTLRTNKQTPHLYRYAHDST